MASPRLAVETLSALPDFERYRAEEDFYQAMASWKLAHWHLKHRGGAWKLNWLLDLHRARRFWRHYSAAVRAAQGRKLAA